MSLIMTYTCSHIRKVLLARPTVTRATAHPACLHIRHPALIRCILATLLQVWDRVAQLYKGHQCIHHGQGEGSSHQEAPPHVEDVLFNFLCDKLRALILSDMLQICND
ncbi:TPA: hypothetical protein ACH3X1_006312 [Trebouxia sp. C0004]